MDDSLHPMIRQEKMFISQPALSWLFYLACKKFYLTSFLFIFAMLTTLSLASAAPPNLLVNPSFEENTGSGGTATNWISSGAATTELWANHTGSWGMAMCSWINGGTGEASQEVIVIPNTPYTYTIWTLRDPGTLTGNFYIKLAWYQGTSLIREDLQDITVPSDNWVQQTLSATSPTNADKVLVIFGSTNINLTGKFDDIELTAGNTFYVRPDGDDLNSGTENTPTGAWKTIQKAADTLNPADVVEVQAGIYNEQVIITRSGLVNHYITFKANGEVIMDGQNINPYCIKLDGADYVKIEGFTVRNATDNGMLLDNGANYNIITNNTCHSNGASGIRLNNLSTYNTISNNTCYSNGYGTSAYGDRPCGIYLFNSSNYNTLDSNISYNNSSTGIWLEGSSSYCTLKNNKTYSNGWGGIIVVGDTNYNTVSYNLIYSNGVGVDLSYGAHDNIFQNNAIHNNSTNGIQSNNAGYSNTLKNNIIINNGLNNSYAYGINIEAGSSATSLYNNLYNNGQGGNRNYYGLSIGPGDISLDPYFKSTDPLSLDFLKLQSLSQGDLTESPCIDAGNPNDIPSSQSGKRIDMGVYDLYSHLPIQEGLLAEYFDNQDFTNLKLVRIDPRINFDWGSDTPDASIGVDTFSVRWQGQIKIDYAQNYTFYLVTDDGSRLWIDNQLIIDKWFDQGPNEYSATISLAPGLHDIKYEYYENGGWAVAKLYWSSPSINKTLIPPDHLYYFGTLPQDTYVQGGLRGIYSKFTNFYGSPSYIFTRVDPQINFDWGGNMSDSALGNDTYSVKWKGKIKIPTADTYTFYTTTDDGVRLWIDNQVLIDAWWNQGATERQGSIYLTPGLYDIELNYYENGGSAVCKLLWSSSTIAKSLIPPTNLYYQKDDAQEGGLYAEYFDNIDLTNPKIKRIDPNIDLDWISFSPDTYLQSDTYSIRWQGQVKADYNETYILYANSDDGLKLWIDNQLLIDTWFDHGSYETQAPINLTAGWHDIKVEYYDNTGWAAVKLAYSSPSTPKTIIPQDHLRTTLSIEDASLNLYSTLNNIQDVQTPVMGHSGSIIQTGTGQVTFESAKFSNGTNLSGTPDGVNKEMILLSSSDLNKSEGTIEFWFKPNWNSDDGVFHKLFNTDWSWDGCVEIFKYLDNCIHWKIVKDGVQHVIVSDATRKWNAGEWHHLAVSYGPQGMKFYLDYQELPISWTFNNEAPYAGALPDIFASDIYLGGSGSGEQPSDAIFDELKIYNKQIVPSDTKAPIIAITSHQDNQVVNSSPVTILGTIDDNLAVVKVNNQDALVVNGTFTSQPIVLSLGPNTIIVEATDQSNNQSTKQITIIYERLNNPPVISNIAPPSGSTFLAGSNINIEVTASDPDGDTLSYQFLIDGAVKQSWSSSSAYPWTTGPSDVGIHTITCEVKDIFNAQTSQDVTYEIILDTTPPTGTIKINNDAQYTNSIQVTLNLSATDFGSGLDKMQFSNDGTNYSVPEPYATTKPWNLELGDGEKTVYAKFSDVAGNWSAAVSDTIILDTTAPAQSTIDAVTSPTNINSQTITGTKSTDTIIIIVTCPTATVGEVTYPTATTWSCILANLTEGNNDITVTAQDAAGNESATVSRTIVLDTILPTASITEPLSGATLSGTVAIMGTAEDINFSYGVLYYGEGTSPTSWHSIANIVNKVGPQPGLLADWDTIRFSNGSYVLRLVVYDIGGNQTIVDVPVNLYNVTIYNVSDSPDPFSPNGDSKEDSTLINATLTSSFNWTINIKDSSNTLIRSFTGSGNNISVIWDGKNSGGDIVADGVYNYIIDAYDPNTQISAAQKTGTIDVDNTPPQAYISQPQINEIIGGVYEIRGLANDLHFASSTGAGGQSYLAYGVGTSPSNWISLTTIYNPIPQEDIIYNWDTTQLATGSYVLRMIITDHAENITTITVPINICKVGDFYDTTDPFSPNGDGIKDTTSIIATFSQVLNWTIDIKDSTNNLIRTFTGNGKMINQVWDGKDFSGIFVGDGTYTYYINAIDPSTGVIVFTGSSIIEVDNTPPAGDITYPLPGEQVTFNIPIYGIADDLHFDGQNSYVAYGQGESPGNWNILSYIINPVPYEDILAYWDTTQLVNDTYTLRLVVRDTAGNLSEKLVRVNTYNVNILDYFVLPDIFSPDGDGNKDTTTFSAIFTMLLNWNISVKDIFGNEVKAFSGSGNSLSQIWDGTDSTGTAVVADGSYSYYLIVTVPEGYDSSQVSGSIAVDTESPFVEITSPTANQIVFGSVPIVGTASDINPASYTVEYGTGTEPISWMTIITSDIPVINGTLANWNTYNLSDGVYTIRLRVEDTAGHSSSASVTVTIDNIITNISINPSSFIPSTGEEVTISYTIDRNAAVTIKIYDLDNNLIRTLINLANRQEGQNSEIWDGKNDLGTIVPDGGYTITIDADQGSGWYQSYGGYNTNWNSVSNFTVTQNFNPYNNELCEIKFTLSENSLFSLGVGQDENFSTSQWLIEAKPLPAGSYVFYWDGRDSEGRILDYYTQDYRIVVVYDSLNLPENTIIVTSQAPDKINVSSDPYAIVSTFGEFTIITYTIPNDGNVSVSIYNPPATLIKKLVDNQSQTAGTYSLTWDGTDSLGKLVSEANDYIIKVELTSGGTTITRSGNITIDFVGRQRRIPF